MLQCLHDIETPCEKDELLPGDGETTVSAAESVNPARAAALPVQPFNRADL